MLLLFELSVWLTCTSVEQARLVFCATIGAVYSGMFTSQCPSSEVAPALPRLLPELGICLLFARTRCIAKRCGHDHEGCILPSSETVLLWPHGIHVDDRLRAVRLESKSDLDGLAAADSMSG